MKRRFGISLLLLIVLFAPGRSAVGADSGTGNRELDRIRQEMRRKKKQLKSADRKERSVLADLESIDREIQSGSEDLAGRQQQLREAEMSLAGIEESKRALDRDLVRLRRAYAQRIRALYKMSRNGGYATAVLSDGNADSAYRRFRALATIAERDRRLMRDYGESLERLAILDREIRDLRADILARTEAAQERRTELESRRTRKAALLSSLKRKKSVYEATLRDLEETSVNLWEMIRRNEKERGAPAPEEATASAQPAGSGRLPWPVRGRVLTPFGMQRHPQFGTMVYRRGIEIEAKTGEEVHATDAGTVAYADWYKGYGELVIIDHGSGVYTLYGHLSRLDVKRDDRVERGAVIGLSGDTGSFAGPRLYFEMRRRGEAVDPLVWLAKH